MLAKKVAIVTGASRGIGKEIAKAFAKAGVKLAIMGSSEEIHKTRNEIVKEGHHPDDIISIKGDVSQELDVEHVVEVTTNTFGQLDILVNNAGIGSFKPVEQITVEEWKKTFEVNVQGVFLFTKTVLPVMKAQKSGTIITISSDVARYTIPNGSLYTATKYAVQGFMGSVSQEVRKEGIRVGTINPGMVDTYFADSKQGEAYKTKWLKAKDIADAVLYMASAPKYALIDEIQIHPLVHEYPRI
jgi:NADP-dependent 3-hydroxy acid dehydrogenase YdfG